ncbi:MAG: hypothetical protein MZW92_37550 [Comamonadaceae bacterium]|nr:hypothetical protein [Comamonadaceae bacterium]
MAAPPVRPHHVRPRRKRLPYTSREPQTEAIWPLSSLLQVLGQFQCGLHPLSGR